MLGTKSRDFVCNFWSLVTSSVSYKVSLVETAVGMLHDSLRFNLETFDCGLLPPVSEI